MKKYYFQLKNIKKCKFLNIIFHLDIISEYDSHKIKYINYSKLTLESIYFRGVRGVDAYGASGAAPREARGRTGLPDLLPGGAGPSGAPIGSDQPDRPMSLPQAPQPQPQPPQLQRHQSARPLRRKDSVARLTLSGISYVVTVSTFLLTKVVCRESWVFLDDLCARNVCQWCRCACSYVELIEGWTCRIMRILYIVGRIVSCHNSPEFWETRAHGKHSEK